MFNLRMRMFIFVVMLGFEEVADDLVCPTI